MRSLLSLSLLSLLPALPLISAANLEIDHLTPSLSCPRPSRPGDTLSMHYRGTLHSDGTQFDASYDRGQPLSFKLGAGQVIKGWDQGLEGMCVGMKRRLTIAPELAYGDRGAGGVIPGGAVLVFEVELVGIKGVGEEGVGREEEEEEEEEGVGAAAAADDDGKGEDEVVAEQEVGDKEAEDKKEEL